MRREIVGKVRHYYTRLGVVIVALRSRIKIGDTVQIIGCNSDYTHKINCIEKDHVNVQSAQGGDDVAIRFSGRIKEHDVIYKILTEE